MDSTSEGIKSLIYGLPLRGYSKVEDDDRCQ